MHREIQGQADRAIKLAQRQEGGWMTSPPEVEDAFLPEESNKHGSQGTTDTSSSMQIEMQEIATHATALDPSWQTIDPVENIQHRLPGLRLEEASTSMQQHSKPHIFEPILYTTTMEVLFGPILLTLRIEATSLTAIGAFETGIPITNSQNPI